MLQPGKISTNTSQHRLSLFLPLYNCLLVEVSTEIIKEMRLSPLLVAVLAASTTLSLSTPARGQTVKPASLNAQQAPGSSPGTSAPPNVVVPAEKVPATPPGGIRIQTPALPPPNQPVTQPLEIIPRNGTENTPRQETPNTIQFDITPKPTPPEINQPTPNPSPVIPSTTPTPKPTPSAQPEARVLVAEVAVKAPQGELPSDLKDEVYKVIRARAGRTTTRSQLQEDVNAIDAIGDFSKVEVVPEDTPLGVRVTFVVQPNPVLQKVTVITVPEKAGNRVLPEKVLNDFFSPEYGRILNLRQLQEAIKNLNKWYKDNGYDLAQVVDVPQVAADGTVTLVVAEGVIEDVQVHYLNKEGSETDDQGKPIRPHTRQFIIRREVQLAPGNVFNRKAAEQDLRRVYGLGIFEDVRLSFSPGQDPRKVIVVVNVIEKNTGSIAAGAGVSSASGLFGTISYQQQNLGGNDQKLGAEIDVGQRDLLFDLNFTDPWIAGSRHRTSYTVDAFQRRTISLIFDGGPHPVTLPNRNNPSANGDNPRVVRLGSSVTFSRPLSPTPFTNSPWRASLGLEYQRVSIRDSNSNLSPRDALGNNLAFSSTGIDDLLTLQLGVVRDLRNSYLQPTKGSLLRLGVEQSVPIGSGNILLNRLRGSYSYYMPIKLTRFGKGAQALAFNLQAGTILGDLPPYEAFSLGGSNSVRGYDEGDVGSSRSFVQGTAEYRFPLFSIIGGALFIDAASDLGTDHSVPGNPAGIRGKPGSGIGYGLGVRVQSPLGPIRVDYGINDQGHTRIHFGIGERF